MGMGDRSDRSAGTRSGPVCSMRMTMPPLRCRGDLQPPQCEREGCRPQTKTQNYRNVSAGCEDLLRGCFEDLVKDPNP